MDKSTLRIVFFGTPDFAVESLKSLVENGFNVVGVVTMPDKPAGRGHKLLFSPVKKFALENNLNILQPVNLKDPDFVESLRNQQADLFIVIAFRMLPEVVWTMPPLGTFNLHASLLPKYRGAAPINHAVMNGDTVTGVTTFMLKHEIDTGDILQQQSVEILPEDNVGAVHDKLMHIGAALTVDTVNYIIKGDLKPIAQDSLVRDIEPTPAPKIFAEHCMIDWTKSARSIHNLVRGLSPYPAARGYFVSAPDRKPELMKIFTTSIIPADEISSLVGVKLTSPGEVFISPENRFFVAVGDNEILEVLEILPAGKKMMSADAFIRGARLSNPHFTMSDDLS